MNNDKVKCNQNSLESNVERNVKVSSVQRRGTYLTKCPEMGHTKRIAGACEGIQVFF